MRSFAPNLATLKNATTAFFNRQLGAIVVEGLASRIAGRIPFDREFMLASESAAIVFAPGANNRWEVEDELLRITLTAETGRRLPDILMPKAGTYSIPGLRRLTIEVEKTEIRDNDGNVTDVLG